MHDLLLGKSKNVAFHSKCGLTVSPDVLDVSHSSHPKMRPHSELWQIAHLVQPMRHALGPLAVLLGRTVRCDRLLLRRRNVFPCGRICTCTRPRTPRRCKVCSSGVRPLGDRDPGIGETQCPRPAHHITHATQMGRADWHHERHHKHTWQTVPLVRVAVPLLYAV